ncbi:sugar phosphate permease [Saccharopolyspora lacisalsi]|uniref:Sugar phosphate permease n=1 Tax=Halosaccharopolyspora lacisalsi TaxID=1000566 RepID=A0A839DYX3_9PSEU|nr:MFS transporter [Halosaccharopolyspora lacisalsi]MBA8824687.1 sugar phosphate permease [Halosaccharopolyspora lacisalsi]
MRLDNPTRRAWLIWGSAVVVYIAAVFHRGSLGVAGPQALDRFTVGPAALSTFTVLQVGLYATMQIPTGVLVDRFGPRRVLIGAATLLGAGQTLFALADTYALGLAARAVLGIGDAMTWVAVLRLVAVHFPARLYPLVATLSSALGALGGVAATFPLSLTLGQLGWTTTFLLAGITTLGFTASSALLVRDGPPPHHGEPRTEPSTALLHRLRTVWTVPGTRLAFWVHFSTMFVSNALSLLWGYPYLTDGLGIPASTASMVLSLLIIGQVLGGPVVGTVIGRRPAGRMPIVLTYLTVEAACLTTLMTWPDGHPPLPVVATAFFLFALGGPVSAIAFALARDYNPLHHVGTATGIANTAGHTATATAVLTMGLVLDLVPSTSTITGYRIAFLAPTAILLLGLLRTTTWWRRTRSTILAAQQRGEDVPVPIRPHKWDLDELRHHE